MPTWSQSKLRTGYHLQVSDAYNQLAVDWDKLDRTAMLEYNAFCYVVRNTRPVCIIPTRLSHLQKRASFDPAICGLKLARTLIAYKHPALDVSFDLLIQAKLDEGQIHDLLAPVELAGITLNLFSVL